MSPGLTRRAREKAANRIKESTLATSRNRLMGLAGVGLAGAYAVAALLVLGDRDDETAPPAAGGQAPTLDEGTSPPERSSPQAASASIVETVAPEIVLELGDLHAACPSFRDGVDAHCLAVLDGYFLGRPVYSTILPVADAQVWADVFDDPAAARGSTLKTLAEETCHVPKGDIRRNVGKVCDVRSMVEQAILLRECSRDHESVVGYEHFDRELSKIEGVADNSVYWRRRNAIEEDVFRSAWLAERCAAVSADATAPLDHFDISADDIYVSHPPHLFYPDRPLNPGEAKYYRLVEAERLIEKAARLGDAWALAEFRGDAAHVERLFQSDPLQAYIHEAELEVGKVRRRYHREHLEGLEAKENAELEDLDQRYPTLAASWKWQRAKNRALLSGDRSAVRRVDSRNPLAGLNSDELDELRERSRAHSDEGFAIREEFGIARQEIKTRRERDQRMVRLTYAIIVEKEAERVGVDVDVMALYERAVPFSEADLGVARERAREIADARAQSLTEEQ